MGACAYFQSKFWRGLSSNHGSNNDHLHVGGLKRNLVTRGASTLLMPLGREWQVITGSGLGSSSFVVRIRLGESGLSVEWPFLFRPQKWSWSKLLPLFLGAVGHVSG